VIQSAALVSTEVSQVPLASVRRVLELAAESGSRSIVDLDVPLRDAVPSLGTEDDLHAVLASASIIKASSAALEGIVQGDGPEELARALAERYATDVVVLTLGAEGAAVWTDGQLQRAPAPRVAVRDTTGAGDAFLGGLLAALHHELEWTDALRLGTSCAAACCERLGGFPDEPEACRVRALALYREAGGAALPALDEPLHKGTEGSSARFLRIAAEELARAAERCDPQQLQHAVDLIRESEATGGRVHVTGIGKPEHVARYAAALLASTGTPATFLHGTEATHGSVGQLRSGDVLIAISNSGETAELLGCVEAARNQGVRIAAVTARSESSLARAAEVVLDAPAEDEGGPLGLAPRASILVQTLVLQALSVELQAQKGFGRDDYHARHPHGTLGQLSRR
jgi:arabinose-5-phosphate isomerase